MPVRRTKAAMQRGFSSVRDTTRRARSWSRTLAGRLWFVTAGLSIILIVIAALVGMSAWFLRVSPVAHVRELDGKPAPFVIASPGFTAAVEVAARTELEPGSVVELLNDGDGTFPLLWSDLRSARRSITIVNYYASDGAVADTLAAILKERAAAGLPVYYVYDPIGSIGQSDEYFQALRAARVRVAGFRPLRWYRLDRLQHRTHVRSIVIDGTIGYTGGYGFADFWLGNGESRDQWRDVNARIRGPAVRQLQAVFVYSWVEATGDLLVGDLLSEPVLPVPDNAAGAPADSTNNTGQVRLAGIMISPATVGSSAAERMLALTLATARHRLYITNAYFVPDADFVRMLREAAGRGVDVRILTNSHLTDVPLTWLAGRRQYESLLEGGVRIYEYSPTVMHSKTFVADGMWSTVGTVNMDNRSLAFNDEVSLLMLDPAMGARMESLFFDDLLASIEIKLDQFQRRSLRQKLLERGASLLARWL